MFGLVGWSTSVDTSGVLTNAAGLADQSVRINGNDIIVPNEIPYLVGAYAVGPSVTRAQLQSPSLRRVLNFEIAGVDANALPTPPISIPSIWNNPIKLDGQEALDALFAESGAGASRGTILAWLADGPVQPVSGDIRSVRVTAATTLVANAWTNAALTFDQSLPAGRYQVVGGRFFSTNLQAWRCVFVGGVFRPGTIGMQTASQDEPDMWRMGNFGVWGEFNHNTPPTIDFLANGADAAQTGVLDLVKVA